jgi:proteasome accessory factor C
VGTRFLSFGKMAEVVAAGQRVLDHEPENAVLAAALDVVTGSVLAGATPQEATWPEVVARRIRQAGSERRRVRITYAMLWKAGIVERVIEPYRVFRTQRGWEIDAAVVDRDGAVATFTASGILAVEALPERFRRPPDTDHRIERRRRTLAVELAVPFAARWVVELHAESIEVIDEDEDSVTIRAHLLPPVGPRLGLVLLAAGPQAFVVAPATWRGAGQDLARALLAHYSAG